MATKFNKSPIFFQNVFHDILKLFYWQKSPIDAIALVASENIKVGWSKGYIISIDKRWHQWRKKTIRRNLLFCFGKFPPRLLVACTHSLYKAAPPLKLIMFINVPNSLFIPPSSITKHQFELFGHWLQPWLINLSFGNVL